MHSETHHARMFFLAVLLALLALMVFARTAHPVCAPFVDSVAACTSLAR